MTKPENPDPITSTNQRSLEPLILKLKSLLFHTSPEATGIIAEKINNLETLINPENNTQQSSPNLDNS